ncbi:MAG: hypothetical protein ACI9W6_001517 [Motiliproteus sp.]|jgi:hypothetical protein
MPEQALRRDAAERLNKQLDNAGHLLPFITAEQAVTQAVTQAVRDWTRERVDA